MVGRDVQYILDSKYLQQLHAIANGSSALPIFHSQLMCSLQWTYKSLRKYDIHEC